MNGVGFRRTQPPKWPNGYRRTTVPQTFISSLIVASEKRQPPTYALRIKLDQSGAVRFRYHGESIPLTAHRTRAGELADRQVEIFPRRNGEDTRLCIWDPARQLGVEAAFRNDWRRFSFDLSDFSYARGRGNSNLREFLVAAEQTDAGLTADISHYRFLFTRYVRRPGEIIRVRMRGDELVSAHSISGHHPLRLHRLGIEQGEDGAGKREIVIVGQKPKAWISEGGIRPCSKLLQSRQGYLFFYFTTALGSFKHRLREEDVKRCGLKAGQVVEIEPIQGKVSAVIADPEKRRIRFPFILLSQWNGNDFRTIATSRSNIPSRKHQGYILLEQAETTRRGQVEFLFKGEWVPLYVTVPWETPQRLMSFFLQDRGKVIFFSDRPRFNSKERKVLARFVQTRTQEWLTPQRLVAQAEDYAAQGNACQAEGKQNPLDLTNLEQADDLYLDAFLANPKREDYLEEALAVRKQIVIRKLHLARRAYYREILANRRSLFSNSRETLPSIGKNLADFIAQTPKNSMWVAYFLEVLAGMAEGKYASDPKPYRRAFEALPYALDTRPDIFRRFMGGLRILLDCPELAYIPRFILYSPPPGRAKAFEGRRQRVGCPAGKLQLDWDKFASQRKGLRPPERPADPVRAFTHQVGKLRREWRTIQANQEMTIMEQLEEAQNLLGRVQDIWNTSEELTVNSSSIRSWLLRLSQLRVAIFKAHPELRPG